MRAEDIRDAVFRAPGHWCHHPPEEWQRLFAPDLTVRPDRVLCGLCGETLFIAAR
jgi:hypothetical protein